jgi:phosphohistidine phosphatase SixA
MIVVGAWTEPAIILLSALATALPSQSAAPPPALIILIRHAEASPDPSDPHLSEAGVKRAERLASFITSDPAMTRFGPPVAVFATRTTKDGNGQRSQETVAPLAQRLQLPVQTPLPSKRYTALARRILGSPDYAGKTVVVCWTHSTMPQLAAALGVTPPPGKWKDKVYDRGYLISFPGGKATLATFDQP